MPLVFPDASISFEPSPDTLQLLSGSWYEVSWEKAPAVSLGECVSKRAIQHLFNHTLQLFQMT